MKRVSGIGDGQDYKFNFFWVHAFDNIDQIVAHKNNPFWTKFEEKFGFKIVNSKAMAFQKVASIIL